MSVPADADVHTLMLMVNTPAAKDPKYLLAVAAPIMKNLTLIQPPCAYPCFDLLRKLSTWLYSYSMMLSTSIKADKERFYVNEEILRVAYLIIAGFKAGQDRPLFPFGHPMRALIFADTAKKQMLQPQIIRRDKVTGIVKQRPSDYLTRVPILPRDKARLLTALQMMKQALQEGRIGFGDGDSIFQTEMSKEVEYYEENMARILHERSDVTYSGTAVEHIDGLSVDCEYEDVVVSYSISK